MLRLITPPASEPITLAEAKLHLRVDFADDDDLIGALITAAREQCEVAQRRALITSTWELTEEGFPCQWPVALGPYLPGRLLERPWPSSRLAWQLPRPPLQSIASVAYVAPDGSAVTLDPSAYQVVAGGTGPGLIAPVYGTTWPATRCQPEAVTVRFVAGHADASAVPATTKAAIKLLVGHLYENREPVLTTGAVGKELPLTVSSLLACDDWGSYP